MIMTMGPQLSVMRRFNMASSFLILAHRLSSPPCHTTLDRWLSICIVQEMTSGFELGYQRGYPF